MRILHVVPSFGFGGLEKIVCAVINHADDQHDHYILALNGPVSARAWILNPKVSIISFGSFNSRRAYFWSLFTVLRNTHPDLLMTYNWGATDAIWLGRLAGISQIIHHEHGFNIDESIATKWRRDLIRSILYRLASLIVVVSHEMESMLLKRFRISRRKIKRIPNGIDTSLYFSDDDKRNQMRNSLGYQGSDFVIGFSGRLDPVKNLDLLLDIFGGCSPHDSPFRLLIVGDGPERLRLEARCKVMSLEPYVTFVGAKGEVLPFLRAMDVFLLTSLREQMPLTVLEAMAVGIPVVATRVGELPYIIEDGVNGFLRLANASPDRFVEPLRSLLCSSIHTKLGEAARNRVSQEFPIKSMLGQYSDLIREADAFGRGEL